MNAEYRIESVARRTAEAQKAIADLAAELAEPAAKTEELLSIAESVGSKVISIGKRHELVENEGWPFGTSGAIFTHPNDRIDGWPSAWRIVERAGVGCGAGNTGQHQADTSGLIEGVYQLQDGQWMRVDAEVSA